MGKVERNMMHGKWLVIFFALLVLPLNSAAYVIGGSNLGIMGYDDHACSKPYPPTKPYSFSSQWQIDSYNREVEDYNDDLRRYIDCIEEYVENGKNDIERIKEAINSAINDANR